MSEFEKLEGPWSHKHMSRHPRTEIDHHRQANVPPRQ